jgi:putative zinc finger/helix-turn-helix YgiT family protein
MSQKNRIQRFASTMRCACGGELRVVREPEFEHSIARQRVVVPAEYYLCDKCGEGWFDPTQAEALHTMAVARLRERDMLLLPEEIKAIRAALDLTQFDFERLLGVGRNTVVRWESGEVIPNAATISLLHLLRADRENAHRLAELRGIPLDAA